MTCQFCQEQRKKIMRVMGYTIPLFVLLVVAFVLGAKNPALIAKLPLVGSK